jgi:hypothetical protein
MDQNTGMDEDGVIITPQTSQPASASGGVPAQGIPAQPKEPEPDSQAEEEEEHIFDISPDLSISPSWVAAPAASSQPTKPKTAPADPRPKTIGGAYGIMAERQARAAVSNQQARQNLQDAISTMIPKDLQTGMTSGAASSSRATPQPPVAPSTKPTQPFASPQAPATSTAQVLANKASFTSSPAPIATPAFPSAPASARQTTLAAGLQSKPTNQSTPLQPSQTTPAAFTDQRFPTSYAPATVKPGDSPVPAAQPTSSSPRPWAAPQPISIEPQPWAIPTSAAEQTPPQSVPTPALPVQQAPASSRASASKPVASASSTSLPKASNDPNIKPLRTYESDVADVLSHRNISKASMAIAENKKQGGEERIGNAADIPEAGIPKTSNIADAIKETTEPPSHSGLKWFLALLSLILIAGGIFGGYYFYEQSPLAAPAPQAPVPQAPRSVIRSDSETTIAIDGLDTSAIAAKIKAELAKPQAPDSIEEIVLTESGSTGIARAPVTDVLSAMDITAPDIIARTLQPLWMLGIYTDASGTKEPLRHRRD